MALSPPSISSLLSSSSSKSSTPSSSSSSSFTPSTGQYSLAAAQKTGYTGGAGNLNVSQAPKRIVYSMEPEVPVERYIGGAGLITVPTVGGPNQPIPPKGPTPSLNLSPVQKTQVGNVVGAFQSAIASSRGDRASYNASINYDGMNATRKKLADKYFDRNSKGKKGGKEEEVVDPYSVLTARDTEITAEDKAQQDLLDQQAKDAATEALTNKVEAQRNIDEQSGLIGNERDTTISEQEALAKNAEDNRLNQLRGNIMTRLAQRGVDISRLSPEQITALSGEEGAKAFMDVSDIKDKKVRAIEAVRQSALTKLNELRDKKSINQTAYDSRVNEINSKTAAAKLQAQKELSANIFALTQTKDQQSRADALARVNAAQTYLTAAGVSGSVAANVIANLSSRGLPDATIQSIAKDPKVIAYLKQVEAANLAKAKFDAEQKASLDAAKEYALYGKTDAAITNANKPRVARLSPSDIYSLANFNTPTPPAS